jgi:hypothetical protein
MNCYKCSAYEDTFLFFQDVPMCRQCMMKMTPKQLKAELQLLRTLASTGCYKCHSTEDTVIIYTENSDETLMCAPCLEAYLRGIP